MHDILHPKEVHSVKRPL